MTDTARTILRRTGKTLLWLVIAIVLLILGLITQMVKVLAPERLTPLVEQVAGSVLDAEVRSSRIELTFWHSFPHLTLEVDSLQVVSRSLDSLPSAQLAQLPAGADTLLTLRHFDGGINLMHLPLGRFTIYDVNIDEPMVNLVKVNDSVSNYDIVPPSKEESDTTAFVMPDIAIDCFRISNAKPWRYTSLSDSISGSVQIGQADLIGSGDPGYKLELGGDFRSPLLNEYGFDQLVLGVNGKLKWDRNSPSKIAIENLAIAIDRLKSTLYASIDMGEEMVVESMNLNVAPIDVAWLVSHCPREMLSWIEPFSTDMTVAIGARLTRPYRISSPAGTPSMEVDVRIPQCYVNTGAARIDHLAFDTRIAIGPTDGQGASLTLKSLSIDLGIDSLRVPWMLAHLPTSTHKWIKPLRTNMSLDLTAELTAPYCVTDTTANPSVKANITIPECYLQYGQAQFKRLALNTDLDIDGTDFDKSTFTLNRLLLEGPATKIDLDGKLTFPLTDPLLTGTLKGRINLGDFPPQLRNLLPAKLSGQLTADAKFNLRKSYLTRYNFHRARLTGSLSLNDFSAVTPDSVMAWINHANFRLGTTDAFVTTNTHHVDSLLTVSLEVDTATFQAQGLDMRMARFKGGIGTANRSESSDTASINPIGGKLTLGRLIIVNHDDSTRMRLRDMVIGGTLRRYHGGKRAPQLGLVIQARRASMSSPTGRYNLREADFKVMAHLNPKKKMGRKMQHLFDSLATVHPALPTDTIYQMARAIRKSQRKQMTVSTDESDYMDFGLDNSTKNLLRRWNVRGVIKAKRGRVFTPYFPLRNTLSNLDCTFSLDTIAIRNMHYYVGQTDLVVNGEITNLRRALTSRRHTPLSIRLDLASDTIHINELTRAVFAGAAYSSGASKADMALIMSDDASESQLDKAMEPEEDTASGPLLVPVNIDAALRVRAKNIIYSDMILHRFKGNILMHEGALNLNELSAHTDIGSASLTALYTAPDVRNMEFGFGMQVKDFQIGKFTQMFPALDSIMPMLSEMDGIINADIAATSQVDSLMNLDLPTLRAAVKIEGDSLVLLDRETFRTLAKWLMFKNKKRNMIDHMSVEMVVENSQLQLYPFMFDMDRYRLGIMGHNDMALNLDYHISVLKSPLPFKFGINIKGTFDDMKIRPGGAKFKENMVYESVAIADTTRINLVRQIENVFRRGVRNARLGKLQLPGPPQRRPIDNGTEDDAAIVEQYNSLLNEDKAEPDKSKK